MSQVKGYETGLAQNCMEVAHDAEYEARGARPAKESTEDVAAAQRLALIRWAGGSHTDAPGARLTMQSSDGGRRLAKRYERRSRIAEINLQRERA